MRVSILLTANTVLLVSLMEQSSPAAMLDPGALIERSILCFHRAAGLNDNSKLCEASPRAARFIVFLIVIAIKHFGKDCNITLRDFTVCVFEDI